MDDVSTGYIDPAAINYANYGFSATDVANVNALYYRGMYGQANTNPGAIQTFQRGDPKENDAFFSGMLRFGWRLNSADDSRSRRQLRCPVFY